MYSLETIEHVDFELSSHCNSKCPQCPRYDVFGFEQKDLFKTHLTLSTVKNIPTTLMPNLKNISFIGNFGDPLMNPHLDEILDYFSKQEILLSTNASLRNIDWWKDLGKRKNVTVTFCIDGLADTHEIYRRGTSFKKIIDNAKSFIASGGRAIWQLIVFKHNEHQINQIQKISKDMGFEKVEAIYSDRFDVNDKFKVYDKGKYLYDLEKASNQELLRERLKADDGQKYWNELNKNKGEISCIWSIKKHIYVHSDGMVYPCCWMASANSGRVIEKSLLKKLIGNFNTIDLKKNSLEKIISSDVFQQKLPNSFKGLPFSHPICIETCNLNTGKIVNRDLNLVNSSND